MGPKDVHITRPYPSFPSIKQQELFIQKHQNHTILLHESVSVRQLQRKKNDKVDNATTTLSKYTHLGDDLVTEDNFSADTKGERFSRLFEGDGAFLA